MNTVEADVEDKAEQESRSFVFGLSLVTTTLWFVLAYRIQAQACVAEPFRMYQTGMCCVAKGGIYICPLDLKCCYTGERCCGDGNQTSEGKGVYSEICRTLSCLGLISSFLVPGFLCKVAPVYACVFMFVCLVYSFFVW